MARRPAEALDFWIQFTARISRRPEPWILLHRLLSVPLLLRLESRDVAAGDVAVRLRSRSDLRWLLGDTGATSGPCDVEIVQVHPWAARVWRRRGWVTVPSFVRLCAPLRDVPPKRMSKSLRNNLSLARRSGFRARPGAFGDWPRARRMVESWARARFEGDVWMPPEHAWRRMRRHGRLLVVGDGERDVAVAIVIRAAGGREAWFTALGLDVGDAGLLRAGAVTAVYEAVVADAHRAGAELLDTGRCSSRTDDPIAAYKSRWGLRPTIDPFSPVFAIRAHTRAGRLFLASRPARTLGRGGRLTTS